MKKLVKTTIFTVIYFSIALNAKAASGQSAGWDEHSQALFVYQLVNVSILLVTGIVFLRKFVAEFFKMRFEAYRSHYQRSQARLKEVQEALSDLESRIQRIKHSWSETILHAQNEANQLKLRKIEEQKEKFSMMERSLQESWIQKKNSLVSQINSTIAQKLRQRLEERAPEISQKSKLIAEDIDSHFEGAQP